LWRRPVIAKPPYKADYEALGLPVLSAFLVQIQRTARNSKARLAVGKPAFLQFAFPSRWHYDILRALDYLQSADAPCDPRLTDAIEIVRRSRREDGRWDWQQSYRGKTYFELEKAGAASRWNTLRALRVLRWWERRSGEAQAPLKLRLK
jgi:hypothetical protein